MGNWFNYFVFVTYRFLGVALNYIVCFAEHWVLSVHICGYFVVLLGFWKVNMCIPGATRVLESIAQNLKEIDVQFLTMATESKLNISIKNSLGVMEMWKTFLGGNVQRESALLLYGNIWLLKRLKVYSQGCLDPDMFIHLQ